MSTTPRTDRTWDSAIKAAEYSWGVCPEMWENVACDMRDHARKLEEELSLVVAANSDVRRIADERDAALARIAELEPENLRLLARLNGEMEARMALETQVADWEAKEEYHSWGLTEDEWKARYSTDSTGMEDGDKGDSS